jgi:hypothetical protein
MGRGIGSPCKINATICVIGYVITRRREQRKKKNACISASVHTRAALADGKTISFLLKVKSSKKNLEKYGCVSRSKAKGRERKESLASSGRFESVLLPRSSPGGA